MGGREIPFGVAGNGWFPAVGIDEEAITPERRVI